VLMICTSKMKSLLLVFVLLLGFKYSIGQTSTGRAPPAQSDIKLPSFLSVMPPAEDRKDDAMKKLLKARFTAALGEARDYYEFEMRANEGGPTIRDDPDFKYALWRRVLQAGLDVYETPVEKVALLERFVTMTRDLEELVQKRYQAGRCRIGDLDRAKYERIGAEIRLLRAKRSVDSVPNK
jgi:hypothetical protein